LEVLEERTTPAMLILTPVADNTMYEVASSGAQQLSNGKGEHFIAGQTKTGALHRAAIQFDLSAVPAGSTIDSVSLKLRLTRTDNAGQSVALHRALQGWGEGNSDANPAPGSDTGEGKGANAATNDATWFYSFFNSQLWNTPGGSFAAGSSATTTVNGVGLDYFWSGAGMVADAQQWVDDPSSSFGWILTGNEGALGTDKVFASKDIADSSLRPVLTVNYTPHADLVITKSHAGNFNQGDAAAQYTISVGNAGSLPTSGLVTVSDVLPAGLTYVGPGAVNGWTVTAVGQTVTATRIDALAANGTYPALTLTVSVSPTAPASVTNTATVSGGGEARTDNDSASDPTTIVTVIVKPADLTISMSKNGDFSPNKTADLILQVKNVGEGVTTGLVTVTTTLPAGLSYVGPSSVNGWIVVKVGQTITATRSDSLAPGASYPPLRLTVKVAPRTAVNFQGSATVSGGGEVNTTNNLATLLIQGRSPRRRGA